MTGYIYLIRNSINGKGYVGQTISTVWKRFSQHKIDAKAGKNYLLYRAMRKYGVENFTVHTILSCEAGPLLNEMERHCINVFGTFMRVGGYNATYGGDGSSGLAVSEATRAKMSVAKKGRARGPFSEEHRRRMSLAKLGNKNGRGRKGMIHSAETKAKISFARKQQLRVSFAVTP